MMISTEYWPCKSCKKNLYTYDPKAVPIMLTCKNCGKQRKLSKSLAKMVKWSETTASVAMAALLTTSWPDGTITRDPATTMEACQAAANAWTSGFALPLNAPGRATQAICQPTTDAVAGFRPGWNCISGFNCER